MSRVLGIDTSNYTTSLAVLDTGTMDAVQKKRLLPVKEGEKGLRQSDAVFYHVQRLPELMDMLLAETGPLINLKAVGVSSRPRSVAGSYMPCFTVGLSVARMLSAAMGLPLYSFSHQEGHLAAALYSAGQLGLINERFLAFHVSGGTTEALLAEPDGEGLFTCKLAAETLDLNAGQLIDRVGVMLGLNFPAGPALEQLALSYGGQPVKGAKPAMKSGNCCFSGGQNLCEKMFHEGKSPEEIAAFCLQYIGDALDQMCGALLQKHGELPVLFAGGVMSNSILKDRLSHRYGAYFAEPRFSSDNGLGAAVLAGYKAGLI